VCLLPCIKEVSVAFELPSELEAQLKAAAQAQGISVGQYVEKLVAEMSLRRAQVSDFKAAIAERLASLNEGETTDGEDVMSRLIAEFAAR
jgi:predicted transcriptional regulator